MSNKNGKPKHEKNDGRSEKDQYCQNRKCTNEIFNKQSKTTVSLSILSNKNECDRV